MMMNIDDKEAVIDAIGNGAFSPGEPEAGAVSPGPVLSH